MLNLRTSLNNNKKYIKFIMMLLFLGFLIGFILYNNLDNSIIINEIKNIDNLLKDNNINFMFNHFVTVTLLVATSIIIVGLVLIPLYIIYEGVCITYSILSFINVFKFNGLIYGLLYNILIKGLYLALLVIIYINLLKIFKLIVYDYKNINNIKVPINNNIKIILVCFLFISINDLLVFLFMNKILSWWLFILN